MTRPGPASAGPAGDRPAGHLRRPRGRLQRFAILAAYVAVFWLLLPWVLWRLAGALDGALESTPWPHAVGWLVAAGGGALMAGAMAMLWREGGGLPVSALPPPHLAIRGPYRWVRHPIYAGFNLLVLGVGVGVGSTGLAWVIAPALLPCWIAYARVEERGLTRRFGNAYPRYRREVGMLPRFPAYGILRLAMWLSLFPTRVVGREHVPREGGVILIANHACYLDFLFVGKVTLRRVRFLTTAEVFRRRLPVRILRHFHAIALRRYRPDPVACREMLRALEAGHVVGIFPEGERSPLGPPQRSLPGTARALSRLPVPVVPVGISGAYDVGARWADKLRRRPLTVRVGQPLDFGEGDPVAVIDEALRVLVDDGSWRVHLEGLDLGKLERVLWRCPRCRDEAGWRAETLECGACGARWRPTGDGRLADDAGSTQLLEEVARPLWEAPEEAPLRLRAAGRHEVSMFRPIGPLAALGEGDLEVGPDGLRFGDLFVPLAEMRTVTTERADTLQVATSDDMWQFVPASGSAFRLQRALESWRTLPSSVKH